MTPFIKSVIITVIVMALIIIGNVFGTPAFIAASVAVAAIAVVLSYYVFDGMMAAFRKC
ncbi:hypothetical protein OBP_238 [Pseudomonas phage OBP]|uniref:hypothetical protein n=1 Tax=Pseudomonas phage OBP TaxID=1124849 RepID=UPI000240D5D2|nr:hypothetical protein OBP_238 [Pseudomonas phage OBP]AEV89675.1 hypothetical protein OBP_238 [Pseudomonas phage OBP]